MQGGGGEGEGEEEEEECEGVVAGGEPPFGEVGFDVEESLEGEADAPEDGHVSTEGACQKTSGGEFPRVDNADQAEGDDGHDDIASVDPIHLSMESREGGEFAFPVHLDGDEG